MSQNRIKELKSLLKETPKDPFLIYGLFLEYLKRKDTINTEVFIEKLWNDFPDYLPSYYHIAKYYQEKGEDDYALQAYVRGIKLAKEQEDTHTLAELEREYEFLLEDMM